MEIKFNLTGKDRKALVGAISEIIGAPFNYKGAPNFSYVIGDYTVDREGTLTSANDADISELLRALHERGYAPDTLSTKLVVEIPKEGLTEAAMANLDRLLASKGNLIKKAIGADSLA